MIRRHRNGPAQGRRPIDTLSHAETEHIPRVKLAGEYGWCMTHDSDVPATHVADWTDPEDGKLYRKVRLCDECGERR